MNNRNETATSTPPTPNQRFRIGPKFVATIPPTGIFLQFGTIFSLTFVNITALFIFFTQKNLFWFLREVSEKESRSHRKMLCKDVANEGTITLKLMFRLQMKPFVVNF